MRQALEKEAISDCNILNAKPIFAEQTDGAAIVSNEPLKQVQNHIDNEQPDIIFTHWPINTHKDHQDASLLTIQTCVANPSKFNCIFLKCALKNKQWVFTQQI
nr:PIG-L family deacetylase [Hydrotalea sp.]